LRAGCLRDLGVAAGAADQVPLGDELLVGLDHDTAGQAEVVRERAGGRQYGVRAEQAFADPLADAGLQLLVQGHGAVALDLDQQLTGTGTGPGTAHGIGPYPRGGALSG
jgi:hypothetical protein